VTHEREYAGCDQETTGADDPVCPEHQSGKQREHA